MLLNLIIFQKSPAFFNASMARRFQKTIARKDAFIKKQRLYIKKIHEQNRLLRKKVARMENVLNDLEQISSKLRTEELKTVKVEIQ